MAPITMMDDLKYGSTRNAILPCQHQLRSASGSVAFAKFTHLVVAELSPDVGRTTPVRRFTLNTTPLCDHISHVIGIGPREQMGTPAAAPVITMMENPEAVGDGADLKDVGNAMCPGRLAVYTDTAIATADCTPGPRPTRAEVRVVRRYRSVLVHMFPKPILKRTTAACISTGAAAKPANAMCRLRAERNAAVLAGGFGTRRGGIMGLHCDSSCRDATPPDVRASRGHSCVSHLLYHSSRKHGGPSKCKVV